FEVIVPTSARAGFERGQRARTLLEAGASLCAAATDLREPAEGCHRLVKECGAQEAPGQSQTWRRGKASEELSAFLTKQASWQSCAASNHLFCTGLRVPSIPGEAQV
ncbi:unnamed protein product, partial [Effrenium voratum]